MARFMIEDRDDAEEQYNEYMANKAAGISNLSYRPLDYGKNKEKMNNLSIQEKNDQIRERGEIRTRLVYLAQDLARQSLRNHIETADRMHKSYVEAELAK